MITVDFRELQGLNDVKCVKVPCRGGQKRIFAHLPILLCLALIHVAQVFTCMSCQLCNENNSFLKRKLNQAILRTLLSFLISH